VVELSFRSLIHEDLYFTRTLSIIMTIGFFQTSDSRGRGNKLVRSRLSGVSSSHHISLSQQSHSFHSQAARIRVAAFLINLIALFLCNNPLSCIRTIAVCVMGDWNSSTAAKLHRIVLSSQPLVTSSLIRHFLYLLRPLFPRTASLCLRTLRRLAF